MPGHRAPGPTCEGSTPVRTQPGTLCLAESRPPASVGLGKFANLGTDLAAGFAWLKTLLTGVGIHWGVDSAMPANAQVAGPAGAHEQRPMLFERLSALAGRAPEFWGRYIGGHYSMTAAEARFLHGQGCRVLMIYNGAHDSAASVRGGYPQGVHDAQAAISSANALGVAAGTFIYADIESGWRVTADWIRGWSDTMYDSEFGGAGGIYANPMPQNAPNFNNPYCQAFNADAKMRGLAGHHGAYIYSSEPEPGCGVPGPNRFAPATAPCNPNTVVWQYAEGCYGGLVDQDLANDVGLWSMW